MGSRLDKHHDQIFEQLNSKGLSYRTVVGNLLAEHHLRISPQALRNWHISRSQKIRERNGRLGPSAQSVPEVGQRATVAISSPIAGPLAAHLKAAEARVSSLALSFYTKAKSSSQDTPTDSL